MKSENYFEFIEELKKVKEPPRVILAKIGDPEKAENIHKIFLEKIQAEAIDDIRLSGPETDAAAFHAELATIPMFDSVRLLWIRHGDALLEKIGSNNTVKGYFQRDFESFPSSTYLFLHFDQKKLPAVFNSLKKIAWELEEKPLREKDLPGFIKASVRQMDFEIEEAAVAELAQKYSMNPGRLNDALSRLYTYCLHEKKIFVKDVKDVCFDVEGDAIFTILDLIAEKKIRQATEAMMTHKIADGLLFLTLLSRLFINAQRAGYLKECGEGLIEIHEKLGYNTRHQFMMRKNEERLQKIRKNYGSRLPKIMGRLVELDKNLKEDTVKMHKNILLVFMSFLEEF